MTDSKEINKNRTREVGDGMMAIVKYVKPKVGLRGKYRPIYEGKIYFHDNFIQLAEHEDNRRIPYSRIYYIDNQ